MGVKGLWRVLQPVREEVLVTSLRGKVLAVDLAIWVVQSETVTNNELQGIYLRQMFYKINHLLEHGVGIIIVTDGRAPHLKALTIARRLGVELDRNSKVIQRRRFMRIMKECEILAQSLGITVLKGAFEAEAAAAKLQQDGLVDGVITTDGDAFLYGARQVYRNLLVTEKQCEVYRMNRVESELGLSRDDLIGLAVLNGCDFNPDGIAGLGRGTTLNYVLSRDRSRTVTEELIGWSQQASEIGARYKQLESITRKPHCGTCKHIGSKREHTASGCECCGTKSGCAHNNIPCTCTKHVAQRLLSSPHMQCCVKFVSQNNVAAIPVKEIVTEFSNTRSNDAVSPRWELPPCSTFLNFMQEKLQWRKQVSAEKFAHVAALHHVSQHLAFSHPYPVDAHTTLQFNHILKRRKRDKVDMFELEYSVLDHKLRSWLEFDVVYAVLDARLVQDLMPDAVREFCEREGRLVRKKKENVPIYERYPVKKNSPDQTKSKPVRPKTARKKKSEKKIEDLSDSLNSLKIDEPIVLSRDITASVSSSTISPVPSSDSSRREDGIAHKAVELSSSDDEYIPLTERLALRKAKSAKSHSGTAVGSTSSLSSLESKQASDISEKARGEQNEGYYIPDQIETETETDNALAESERITVTSQQDDTTLSGSEADGFIDSDVQLLPHNFMEEYLDLSRDQILGISREDTHEDTWSRDNGVGERTFDHQDHAGDQEPELEVSPEHQYNGLSVYQDERSISRENSFLATESVDSEDYKHLIEGGEYHKLFFATPGKCEAGSLGVEESGAAAPHLEIPTMKLSQITSQSSEGGDESLNVSLKNGGCGPSDVINISSDSESSVVDGIEDSAHHGTFRPDQTQNLEPEINGLAPSDGRDNASGIVSEATVEIGAITEESGEINSDTGEIIEGVIVEGDASIPEVSRETVRETAENSVLIIEKSVINTNNSEIITQTSNLHKAQIGHEVDHLDQNRSSNDGINLQESLDISVELDSDLQDVSGLSGGFSPKTPSQQQRVLSDLSDLSVSELSSFTPKSDHVILSPSKPAPLPDISNEPAPLPDISNEPAPLPDISNEPAPLLEISNEPAPLPDISNETAPLLEISNEPAPLPDISNEPAPLLEIANEPAPLPDISNEPAPLLEIYNEPAPLPDISNEPAPLPDISSEPAPLLDSYSEPAPLPDISNELVESVIRESVEEITADKTPDSRISDTDIRDHVMRSYDAEISDKEISVEDDLLGDSVSFSPTQPDPVILVPDTPAPPDKLSAALSRDIIHHVTNHVTPGSQELSQEVSLSAGGAVLGPIPSNNSSLPPPRKLSFDVGDISDFDFSSLVLTENDSSTQLPSTDSLPRDIPPPPGFSSPDHVISGVLSQPHLPPDTSFLEPHIQISTPSWHRKPLSDITMCSTPKLPAKLGDVDSCIARSDPLPDIPAERLEFGRADFNLNITELLETTDVA